MLPYYFDQRIVQEATQVLWNGSGGSFLALLASILSNLLTGDVELFGVARSSRGMVGVHVDAERILQYLCFPCGPAQTVGWLLLSKPGACR